MRQSGASPTGAQNHVVQEERWRVGARGQADRRGLDAHLRGGRAARFAARATAQRRGCGDAGHRGVRLLPCLRHRRARATEGVTALARVSDDLLLAAQSGDRHALTQLLVALQPDIRRYARHLCYRASAIEDVVQEALIVVYRRVGTIRSPAALAGWLLTVITRLCMLPALMLMRGVEELASLEASRELAKVPPDELRIDLVNAIESLSPSHREVLLLRDLEDLTIGEIARRLGVTREATKSRLRRARALVAIPGRGRCRPRRATRMPDVLDCGPGRDAFARPSRTLSARIEQGASR